MNSGFGTTVTLSIALLISGAMLAAQQTTPQAATSDKAAATTSSQSPASSTPDIQPRAVRLSEMQGEVKVDRNLGSGFEDALLNLPITQGMKLGTGAGLAEVEFEDNSLLLLTPYTTVEFPLLALQGSGSTASTIDVERGEVYVDLARKAGNEFRLVFGSDNVLLEPSSHVRLQLTSDRASLAVISGKVQVQSPAGATAVEKNKTIDIALADPANFSVDKHVLASSYDGWEQGAVDYHQHYASNIASLDPTRRYGISDLDYYGHFVNVAGCGRLWRPYLASAAWDPFTNGTWVWYPGAGYSWVSPYPWGWTPYHSGRWEYCSTGWGWRPGKKWKTIQNPPKPPHGIPPERPRPRPRQPLPPMPGTATRVAVNRTPLVASGLASSNQFVMRKDSAGLGVPRETFGNLNHVSGRVEQRGSDNIAVNSGPVVADRGKPAAQQSGHQSVASYGAATASRSRADYSGANRAGYSGADSSRGNYSGEGASRSSSFEGGHSGGSYSTSASNAGGGGGGRK